MGHWNTLHLFDDKMFYEEVVPIMKGNGTKLEEYYTGRLGKALIEDSEKLTSERVSEVIEIAKEMKSDFKVHSGYLAEIERCEIKSELYKIKRKYANELEEFHLVLQVIIFSKCALFNPYFILGKAFLYSFLKFEKPDSIAEKLVNQIMNCETKGNILSVGYDDGIRNWLTAKEVSLLLKNYKDIIPYYLDSLMRRQNQHAEQYVADFHTFLTLAEKNGFGLISCVDVDEFALMQERPIGKNINWKNVNIRNLITRK